MLVTAFSPNEVLQSYHEKILTHIKEQGFITDMDYASLVDRAKATLVLDFQKLIELGLIVRKGSGPTTHYTLTEKIARWKQLFVGTGSSSGI